MPLQPGPCVKEINPAPDGKAHIFDSYVISECHAEANIPAAVAIMLVYANGPTRRLVSLRPRRMWQAELLMRDTSSNREWRWGEGLNISDDRNRLRSVASQALKEFTGTYDYKFGEGFLARLEYRRDWSNVPFFLTNKPGVLSPSQPTFTVGVTVRSAAGRELSYASVQFEGCILQG